MLAPSGLKVRFSGPALLRLKWLKPLLAKGVRLSMFARLGGSVEPTGVSGTSTLLTSLHGPASKVSRLTGLTRPMALRPPIYVSFKSWPGPPTRPTRSRGWPSPPAGTLSWPPLWPRLVRPGCLASRPGSPSWPKGPGVSSPMATPQASGPPLSGEGGRCLLACCA
jgi:hypothetical protein